jgi:ElaB/YqjD/DUF883 family membrane-anchored ribosome-binding protein
LGETTREIETHIRNTRQHLSANIDELEQRVKSAVDWRQHYKAHPGAFVGAALGAGFLLSLIGQKRRLANSRRSV